MQPLSIKAKLTLVAAAVAIVLMLAASAVQMIYVKADFKEVLGRQQLGLVNRVADDLDAKVVSAQEALVEVAKIIPRAAVNDQRKLDAQIANQPILLAIFDDILVLSSQGRILVDHPVLGRRGLNSFALDHIKATIATRKPQISRPFRGPAFGKPFIAMTAPILDKQGRLMAVLVGGLNLYKPNFLGKLADAKVGKSGAFALFTLDRLIMISPFKDRVLTRAVPPGTIRYFDHAMAGLEGWEEDTNSLGIRAIYGYKTLRTVPWVLTARLPVAEAYAPIAVAQNRIILITAVVIVLLASALWLTMRYLLEPLQRVRESIRELSSGQNTRVSVGAKDEIGELGVAFNALMDSRQHANEKLADSEKKFRSLTQLSSDWYWEQDAQFRFTRIEGPFLATYNGPDAQADIGKTRWEVGYGNLSEEGWLEHRRVLESHQPFQELECVRYDAEGNIVTAALISGEPMFDARGDFCGYRGVGRDIFERKRLQEEIARMALHDELTGLANLRLLNQELTKAIAQARRARGSFALIYLDLDGFKPINDTLGHDAGDKVLREIASRLLAMLRETDTVARIGGDEFVALATTCNTREEAAGFADRLRAAISQPFLVGKHEVNISCSIGIALYPDDALTATDLLNTADKAMYEVKRAGRGVA